MESETKQKNEQMNEQNPENKLMAAQVEGGREGEEKDKETLNKILLFLDGIFFFKYFHIWCFI